MPLEKSIHHKFHNPDLLTRALTLGGYANENPDTLSQEVLCTLGDAVLKAIIVEALMKEHADAGDITRIKQGIESRENLAKVARSFNLGEYLKMGEGEKKQEAQEQDNVLAETLV
ncbi:MAG: ribonuclease III, partial [Thermoplasmata archaeon]|nr:ribonuclease III [Thermoplasmata archaeon]